MVAIPAVTVLIPDEPELILNCDPAGAIKEDLSKIKSALNVVTPTDPAENIDLTSASE